MLRHGAPKSLSLKVFWRRFRVIVPKFLIFENFWMIPGVKFLI